MLLLASNSESADPFFIENPITPSMSAQKFIYQKSNPALFTVNNFVIVISATVGMQVQENSEMMAVAAGSNKGKVVFTGKSDTGEVSPCLPIIDFSDEITPASLQSLSRLDINAKGGCNSESS